MDLDYYSDNNLGVSPNVPKHRTYRSRPIPGSLPLGPKGLNHSIALTPLHLIRTILSITSLRLRVNPIHPFATLRLCVNHLINFAPLRLYVNSILPPFASLRLCMNHLKSFATLRLRVNPIFPPFASLRLCVNHLINFATLRLRVNHLKSFTPLRLCLPFLLLPLTLLSQQQPNVILIFSDDQGSVDLGCYGATDLYTPNLDGLAAKGVRFSQFYVGAPLCSPSRATLLTGKNPHAAGLPRNAPSDYGRPGMPQSQVTIADMMKEAGYSTGHVGKWHVGYDEATMPLAQGFDYSFGHMGGCIDNYSHFFYWKGPNRHDLWENGKEIYRDGQYFPDMMVDQARDFIINHQDKPFFLYFAINLPHYPMQPTARWREHYKDLPMPRRDYAAFVSTVDERVGQLVSTLDQYNLRENTIIIFVSDHGHSCENRAFDGGGSSGPYRGAKTSLFEGGIRVPAIINWKGKLPENKVIDEVSSSMDILPTIADLCGIETLPEGVEGYSLRTRVVDDAVSKHETLYWRLGRQWAIRKGSWKLIGNPRDPSQKFPLDPDQDALFLANLELDVSESKNLASQYPDKVKALSQAYTEWEFGSEEHIPEVLPPLQNLAAGAKVTWEHAPDKKYTSEGPQALVDEKRGSLNFTDGRWLGYLKNDLIATVDLGSSKKVSSISLRCLQDINNHILLPKWVEISVSSDGKTYNTLGKINTEPEVERKDFQIKEYKVDISQKVRYIKVHANKFPETPNWHPLPGRDVFIFSDELIVK